MKYLLGILLIFTVSTSYCQTENDSLDSAEEMMFGLEDAPYPEGGIKSFYKWIEENNKLLYHSDSLTENHKVFVEFFVNKEGTLSNVKVIKGLGEPYDIEALRLVNNNPTKWKPGILTGRPVAVRLVMPIFFVKRIEDKAVKKRQRRSRKE
jgi:protein TonB